MAHQMMAVSREMQECIDECLHCHATCLATIRHCLEMGGRHAEVKHISLMADCAQICQTSADLMLRDSRYVSRACGLCADVCRTCAEDCERIDRNDEMMKECAQACRRCSEACQGMAA